MAQGWLLDTCTSQLRDLEESILRIHGVVRDEGDVAVIKTVRCRGCGAVNPITKKVIYNTLNP